MEETELEDQLGESVEIMAAVRGVVLQSHHSDSVPGGA